MASVVVSRMNGMPPACRLGHMVILVLVGAGTSVRDVSSSLYCMILNVYSRCSVTESLCPYLFRERYFFVFCFISLFTGTVFQDERMWWFCASGVHMWCGLVLAG